MRVGAVDMVSDVKARSVGDIVTVNVVESMSSEAKGNTSLHDAVDKALAAMMADGSYAKISNQWFKEDIRCK